MAWGRSSVAGPGLWSRPRSSDRITLTEGPQKCREGRVKGLAPLCILGYTGPVVSTPIGKCPSCGAIVTSTYTGVGIEAHPTCKCSLFDLRKERLVSLIKLQTARHDPDYRVFHAADIPLPYLDQTTQPKYSSGPIKSLTFNGTRYRLDMGQDIYFLEQTEVDYLRTLTQLPEVAQSSECWADEPKGSISHWNETRDMKYHSGDMTPGSSVLTLSLRAKGGVTPYVFYSFEHEKEVVSQVLYLEQDDAYQVCIGRYIFQVTNADYNQLAHLVADMYVPLVVEEKSNRDFCEVRIDEPLFYNEREHHGVRVRFVSAEGKEYPFILPSSVKPFSHVSTDILLEHFNTPLDDDAITNEEGHAKALAEVERLWQSEIGSYGDVRLKKLVAAIEAYEAVYHPIPVEQEEAPPAQNREELIARLVASMGQKRLWIPHPLRQPLRQNIDYISPRKVFSLGEDTSEEDTPEVKEEPAKFSPAQIRKIIDLMGSEDGRSALATPPGGSLHDLLGSPRVNYSSMARVLFPVESLPEGAKPTYDKEPDMTDKIVPPGTIYKVDEPEHEGRIPVRTELTVLSGDDPNRRPLGWTFKDKEGDLSLENEAGRELLEKLASLDLKDDPDVDLTVGINRTKKADSEEPTDFFGPAGSLTMMVVLSMLASQVGRKEGEAKTAEEVWDWAEGLADPEEPTVLAESNPEEKSHGL